jgi:CelD/BcsL family acetyltransferase involved in cellulose biosynthesis
MKLRVVTSLREFDGLASLWRDLIEASGQRSPFLSHDWFACCWRTAGPNRRREVWIVEDAAGPVALLPLLRSRARVRGIPLRTLALLDAPDTPFIELVTARQPLEVLEYVLRTLRARGDWDVFSLRKLPLESPTFKTLELVLPSHFAWRVIGRTASPVLSITGAWEDFLRGRTPRFRKTCRNVENRVRRAGHVVVEEHRDVDPDGPVFAEVLEVSRASWKGPRGLAMATMQGMPRFFRELTRRASANGWLHLWILRVNGRAVATEYQIGHNGRRYALRADFDAGLAELSPGAYLNQRIVQALFEGRDVHEYDMGPGLNEYKLRWATGAYETVSLDVYAPTARGSLLRTLETRILPWVRRWRRPGSEPCAS